MTFSPPLDDEILQHTLDAVEEHKTISAAAVALGLSRSTVRNRLEHAARRGLTGTSGPVASPGFLVDRKTTLYRHNPDGTVAPMLEWRRDGAHQTTAQLVEALKEVFSEWQGLSPLAPSPQVTNESLCTVYVIADPHLGLLAWGPESGEDYDLNIASALLMRTMGNLVADSPPAHTGIVLNLGDFFHADDDRQVTPRSGNKLSVDGRSFKVLKVGLQLMIYCIDQAKQKHEQVIVRNIPGNHDPETTKALTLALSAFYDNDPRVVIEFDPGPFWVFTWGNTLLAAAHGDRVKPADFPGMIAARWPVMWGQTAYRYALFGHVHHSSKGGGERYGMTWETFRTIAAKDDWHAASGYVSNRALTSITYSLEFGEVSRVIKNIRPT